MNSQTFIVPDRPPKQGYSVDIASGLSLPQYDNGTMTLSNGNTTETYTLKKGSTTVATVTINYTDSTRTVMSNFTKS